MSSSYLSAFKNMAHLVSDEVNVKELRVSLPLSDDGTMAFLVYTMPSIWPKMIDGSGQCHVEIGKQKVNLSENKLEEIAECFWHIIKPSLIKKVMYDR
ncbi:MAG: hypothetical protein U1E51_26080 [Candidatus Binatia bacterium]|nr:hypothetical protein [Candidatus Binatia bacterium]